MSVYQYDVLRTNKKFAKKILHNISKEYLDPKVLSCVQMKDDSVILTWETWHGSPFPDFEKLLTKNRQWLYATEYNDGTAEIQNQYAKEQWKDSCEIVCKDEGDMIQINEFGKKIKVEKLLGG